MRSIVMHAPGDVRVEDRAEPTITAPTDAIIRLSATCICGSDLWPYRGADHLDDLSTPWATWAPQGSPGDRSRRPAAITPRSRRIN